MLEKDVLEIKGKVNTALCYAKVVEEEAVEQIRSCLLNTSDASAKH